jgi:DNA-binding response OmpR family regulator
MGFSPSARAPPKTGKPTEKVATQSPEAKAALSTAATPVELPKRRINALALRCTYSRMRAGGKQSPIILLACRHETMARSLESVFDREGYIPARITSLPRAVELSRRSNYDAIVLHQGLEQQEALDVSKTLRDDPLFDHSTPVIITSTNVASAASRLAAYEAGAWEYCSHPIDLDLLLTKLRTFLRARQELVLAQSQSFIDSRSGLYTSFGLQQIAATLGAGATRKHQAFACVAFSPETSDREVPAVPIIREADAGFADVANVFRIQSRKSDVVGHMGASRLAILAPDTDADGARLLVARLQGELDKAATNHTIPTRVRLRAGFSAVPDLAVAKIDVEELVHRAESALDHLPPHGSKDSVLSFDDLN